MDRLTLTVLNEAVGTARVWFCVTVRGFYEVLLEDTLGTVWEVAIKGLFCPSSLSPSV